MALLQRLGLVLSLKKLGLGFAILFWEKKSMVVLSTLVIKMNYKPKIEKHHIINYLHDKIRHERTSTIRTEKEKKIRIALLQQLVQYFNENYL